eukprot:TRINITY_DN1759_c0_g1_i1.p1 TRINITY_DN1759_c0_g1~~TRINITY_DN1759_c0_g1_i1.p1  ORF type:complete len:454 (-),score=8.09 TRINITY_DN1759_c0_g1_i1:84-1244(-)
MKAFAGLILACAIATLLFKSTEPSSDITFLYLRGRDYFQLGKQYGEYFRGSLLQINDLLYDFYVLKHGIPFSDMYNRTKQLYLRYHIANHKRFIEGMAEGAGLTLEQAIVINGMETLDGFGLPGCAYLYVPPVKSKTGAGIVGRYYDYFAPFDQISKHISVTIIDDGNTIPVTLIGMVGQFMCLTCINKEGLFISINNGGSSGGTTVNTKAPAILSELIEVVQNSHNTVEAASHFTSDFRSDFSLLINMGDPNTTASAEVSSILGTKVFVPYQNEVHAAANLFLNTTWRILQPTDEGSWYSITRRNNLVSLLNKKEKYSVQDVIDIMDVDMEKGGAKWRATLYQVVYDFASKILYVRANKHKNVWQKFDLSSIYGSTEGQYSVNPI